MDTKSIICKKLACLHVSRLPIRYLEEPAFRCTDMFRSVAYVQGEQHGFRKAETIRSALEGELYFYGQVLGFDSAYSSDLQPMTIDNLGGTPKATDKDEL